MKKILTLLFFFSITFFANAQCAGTSGSITICLKESYNEGIGLGKVDLNNIITGESAGGTWAETTVAPCVITGGAGLNTTTGILNTWQIRRGCVYEYTYTCSGDGSTSTVTLTLGGYPGVGTNGDVCSNDSNVNLFPFLGSNPNPDALATPTNPAGGTFTTTAIGAIDPMTGEFDATVDPLGTYNFTYTVPAVGTCPSRSTSFDVTINPKAEAGTTTPLILNDTDDLSGYTAFDLVTLFNASPLPDAGGDWQDTTVPSPANATDGIANPTDSVINLQAIFNTASGGDGIIDQDLVLTFRYTVYPSHPVCSVDSANFTIIIRKTVCPTVSISYASPLCQSASPSGVSMTGTGSYTGGSYYSTPPGLTLNSVNGTITPSTSTAGNYTVNYTTPSGGGCSPVTASTNVTIYPIPVATANPSSQTICSGQTTGIVLSSNISGTTYSWTFTQTGTTGASNGSGNFIEQVLTATGSSIGTVSYTITPITNNCSGMPITVTISVTPPPVGMATPSSQTICSGETTNIVLSSDTPGITFSWNVISSNITGATPGNGNVIFQTLSTIGNNSGSAVYGVNFISNGCQGFLQVDIIVNPIPVVYASTPSFILSGESPTIALTSNISGATYSWTATQNGVTGASNGTGNTIDQVLTTTGVLPGTVTYTITPTANGCVGSPIDVTVTVLYVPGIADGTIGTDGSGNVTSPYLLDTLLSDSNYTCEWTLDGVAFRGTNGVNNVTTNQYYATTPGTYCVTAINSTTGFRSAQGCATVTTQVLSNNEFNTLKLSFSPNPVTDILNISSKEILKKITVFNTLGQTVYSKYFNDLNPKIDLSSLTSGNYFVKVASDSKQNVIKIIKK